MRVTISDLIRDFGRVPLSIDAGLRVAVIAGGLLLFWILAEIQPLRRLTQPKVRRFFINLTLAGVGAFILNLSLFPVVFAAARMTASHQWGLLYAFALPGWAAVPLGLILLDYSFYWWHMANHRLPFFWRFHNVHHVDLDLDVTTGVRFHFAELLMSSCFRIAQIIVLGIDPVTWILFELFTATASQFHHSNWKLPIGVERAMNRILVTPRMHGIHHSIVRGETDSNFSAIFPWWDWLHGTYETGVSQAEITIGTAPYRDPRELGFWQCLLLPFRRQRPWVLPNGEIPKRRHAPARDMEP